MKLSSLFEKPKYPLTGRDIYIDKKNRLVYYKKSTKQGFVISEGQENSFRTMRTRYVLGLCAFALVQIALIDNLFISIPIGIAVAIVMEFKWRKMLNSAPMIQNFDVKSARCTMDIPLEAPLGAIALKIVLFLLLGVLLIINLYTTGDLADDISSIVISYVAAVGAVFFAFKHFQDYQRQKRANQK